MSDAMLSGPPMISIVIPVRNEGARIRQAIASFTGGRSRPFPLEFVIVDDASSDGCCADLAVSEFAGSEVIITVIRLDRWSGIPFARNTGAFRAAAPVLLITDANVRATKGWDIPLFREIRPDRALAVTIADEASCWKGYGCLLDLPSMGVKWIRDPGAFDGWVPVASCAGTVIHKALFRKLGGYDTAMPVYGAAEPEFSVRLWLSGATIRNVRDMVFYHRFRPAEERRPFLEHIRLLQVKNYLRFGLLYLNQEDIGAMIRYWEDSNPCCLSRALYELDMDEIAARRQYLQQRLPYQLYRLTGFFSLPDLQMPEIQKHEQPVERS